MLKKYKKKNRAKTVFFIITFLFYCHVSFADADAYHDAPSTNDHSNIDMPLGIEKIFDRLRLFFTMTMHFHMPADLPTIKKNIMPPKSCAGHDLSALINKDLAASDPFTVGGWLNDVSCYFLTIFEEFGINYSENDLINTIENDFAEALKMMAGYSNPKIRNLLDKCHFGTDFEALMIATRLGIIYALIHDYKEAVKILQGIDQKTITHTIINILAGQDYKYQSNDLILATRFDCIEAVEIIIAQEDINLNVKDLWKWHALAYAFENDHTEIFQILANEDGIDLNKKYGVDEKTMLTNAAKQGDTYKVKLLVNLKSIELNATDKHGKTAAIYAFENDLMGIFQVLVNKDGINLKYGNHKKTMLINAAEQGDTNKVKLLINLKGIDLNATDVHGTTALMYACQNDHIKIVEILVNQKDINLNIRDGDGESAITHAIRSNHFNIVKILATQKSIDLNAKYNYGRSILIYAILKDHTETVKMLVAQEDININMMCNEDTPLYHALVNDKMEIFFILAAHDDIDLNTKHLNTKYGKHKKTMLILATEADNRKIVKKLVSQKDIDLNAKDFFGTTALMYASQNDYIEIVKILVAQKNTNLNIKDKYNMNALMYATNHGHPEVFKILAAQKDINFNIVPYNDENICQFLYNNNAKMAKDPEILAVCLKNGLSLHGHYSTEHEDLYRDALNRLSEEDRESILAERSRYGQAMENIFFAAKAFILPVAFNYWDYRQNYFDRTFYGKRGSEITEGDKPGFLKSFFYKFNVDTFTDKESLISGELCMNSILDTFTDRESLTSGEPCISDVPKELIREEIATYMMLQTQASPPHPPQIILDRTGSLYASTRHHVWSKSFSFDYGKVLLTIPYAYLCKKVTNNIDFSALSPLGNSKVLREEIKSPSRLLTRALDTGSAITHDIYDDAKPALDYLYYLRHLRGFIMPRETLPSMTNAWEHISKTMLWLYDPSIAIRES